MMDVEVSVYRLYVAVATVYSAVERNSRSCREVEVIFPPKLELLFKYNQL